VLDSNRMDYPNPESIIRNCSEHERVRLTYNSVYSSYPQSVEGNLRETDGNKWIRLIDDDGCVYTVFGFGFENYTRGQISKDGRLIGEYMSAQSINQ